MKKEFNRWLNAVADDIMSVNIKVIKNNVALEITFKTNPIRRFSKSYPNKSKEDHNIHADVYYVWFIENIIHVLKDVGLEDEYSIKSRLSKNTARKIVKINMSNIVEDLTISGFATYPLNDDREQDGEIKLSFSIDTNYSLKEKT